MIYVSGPISSDPIGGTRTAVLAAAQLMDAGLHPYVPHLSVVFDMIAPQPYERWMTLDFHVISRCDAVLRLPGISPGADREVTYATTHDIPVHYTIEEAIDRWA